MAKFVRKLKPEFEEQRMDLDEMKLSELKRLCMEYDIPASGSKQDLVKIIKVYEADKYVRPVLYTATEPSDPNTKKLLFIGVHIRDRDALMQVNKMTQAGEAKWHHYAGEYHYFETRTRIKLI